MEHEAKELLALYGVGVPPFRLLTDRRALSPAAAAIGFPLVAKLVSPQVLHKTDHGLLRLGISDLAELDNAYVALLRRAAELSPAPEVRGVLIERMQPPGLEMLVGLQRDPVFGPVLACGLGGIYVETLRDVSYRVAPLDADTAREMLGELRSRDLLQGVRGQAPRDVMGLVSCILAVACLAAEIEEVTAVDLNPVILYERGAVAVDARVLLREEGSV
jgi:acyl-CoA synthetase (NDP forming)